MGYQNRILGGTHVSATFLMKTPSWCASSQSKFKIDVLEVQNDVSWWLMTGALAAMISKTRIITEVHGIVHFNSTFVFWWCQYHCTNSIMVLIRSPKIMGMHRDLLKEPALVFCSWCFLSWPRGSISRYKFMFWFLRAASSSWAGLSFRHALTACKFNLHFT